MPAPNLSIIIPLYNEEESLPELIQWVHQVMETHRFSYELILIDDGSTDGSWAVVEKLQKENTTIKGIRFLRNYGKSAALNIGFRYVKGQVVITIDADLQDSPEEIPELYRMIVEEGYDIVSGWKQKRYDPLSKTIPSKFFNYVTRMVSGIRLHDFNCGLKAYKQKVVHTLEIYGEMHRYIPMIAKWTGFCKIGEKPVQHRARKYGTTKFGANRFITGFLDLISISFVYRFGKSPMHFFGTLGSLFILAGFSAVLALIAEKFYYLKMLEEVTRREVVDQPLFFISLTALIIGIQLFLVGFLGEMITLNNAKRNDYLIEKIIGITHE